MRYGTTLCVAVFALCLFAGTALATVPDHINYQGTLTDTSGNPITGTETMTFSLYADSIGGISLWSETHVSVEVTDGLFNVLLGSMTTFPDALFDGGIRWLETEVASETLFPREKLVAVPYSFRTKSADSAVWADSAGHAATSDTADIALTAAPDNDWTISGIDLFSNVAGNVGIGTSTPSSALDVVGTATATAFVGDGSGLTNVPGDDLGNHIATQNIRLNGNWLSADGGDEGVIVLNDGRVGIGSLPGAKLDVWGDAHFREGLSIGISLDEPLNDLDIQGGIAIGSSYAGSIYAPANGAIIEGNVGIGTSSPNWELDVEGDADISGDVMIGWGYGPNHKLTVHSTSDDNTLCLVGPDGYNFYGARLNFGADDYCYLDEENDNQLTIYSDSYTAIKGGNVAIGEGYPPEKFTVNGDACVTGNMGIGTWNSSRAKVDINGSLNHTLSFTYYALSGHGVYIYNTPVDLSLYASQRIAASEFDAFSDSRIKNIIGRSDSKNDLKTLRDIEITNYTFVDSIGKGNKLHKKVIGQQVKEVYPQAVSISTDVVPDIYQRAEITDGWIDLSIDVAVGDRVKIISEEREDIYEVLEINDTGFRVDLLKDGPIFVYGREVDDFHTVDYEAIAMLNVSATQELAKQLDRLQAESVELNAKLAQIESMLRDLGVKNAEWTDVSE